MKLRISGQWLLNTGQKGKSAAVGKCCRAGPRPL